jgi:hypothetical protein
MVERRLDPAQMLDRYLDHLQGDGPGLEKLVEDLPSSEEELKSLLVLSAQVQQAFEPLEPSPEFERSSLMRLMNTLRAMQRAPLPSQSQRSPRKLNLLRAAPALASVALIVALLLGSIGVVSASADSLPGDGLYPLKRGYEETRLALTFTDEGDQALLREFAEERLREIEALTDAGRVEDLDEAVTAFIETLDRLESLSQDNLPGEGAGPNLGNNLEVLLGVQEKVPPQAQPAIQRAIERAAEHDLHKIEQKQDEGQPASGNDERNERKQEAEQERNLRTAEQIARKHGLTSDQVLSTFNGTCSQDWTCVREHYRTQDKKDKR